MNKLRYRIMLIGVAMATLILVSGDGWAVGTSYVAVGGGHIEPYDNWERAANSLHAAVNLAAASNWTTVLVSNGTYYLSNEVTIAKAMTVRSWNNNELDIAGTVIDCHNYAGKPVSNRAFRLDHTGAVVQGFTITNGNPVPAVLDNGGGAIYVNRGIVLNCIVRQNAAFSGGGIYINGTGSVIGCTIQSNSAFGSNGGGGGLYVDAGRSLISNCVIIGNTACWGGGGAKVGGLPEIVDSMIMDNVSTNSAYGGLWLTTAGSNEYLVRNCTIAGNTVLNNLHNGGGIGVSSLSKGRLETCIISNNYAGRDGGGIYLNMATGLLVNCLIAGNTAGRNHGGLYGVSCAIVNCTIAYNSAGTSVGGVSLTAGGMTNSIIYGNIGGASSNYSLGAGVTAEYCCSLGASVLLGDGNLNTNPLFVASGARDFRLSASSPCLDAGTNQEWMVSGVDLDGLRRVDRFRGRVDIGAYEYLPQGMLFLLR